MEVEEPGFGRTEARLVSVGEKHISQRAHVFDLKRIFYSFNRRGI